MCLDQGHSIMTYCETVCSVSAVGVDTILMYFVHNLCLHNEITDIDISIGKPQTSRHAFHIQHVTMHDLDYDSFRVFGFKKI